MSSQPDIPTQRERQRAETRERLFQAAVEEFRLEGVANARIERIAAAASVVRGTFYFHFPTKDHVLEELQLRSQERILDRLETVGSEGVTIADVLEALLEGMRDAEGFVANVALLRSILARYVRKPMEDDRDGEPSPIAEHTAKLLSTTGALRADIAPIAAAELILTSLFGVFAANLSNERRTEAVRIWVDVLSHGLATS